MPIAHSNKRSTVWLSGPIIPRRVCLYDLPMVRTMAGANGTGIIRENETIPPIIAVICTATKSIDITIGELQSASSVSTIDMRIDIQYSMSIGPKAFGPCTFCSVLFLFYFLSQVARVLFHFYKGRQGSISCLFDRVPDFPFKLCHHFPHVIDHTVFLNFVFWSHPFLDWLQFSSPLSGLLLTV